MTATHFSIESGAPAASPVVFRRGPFPALRLRSTPTETQTFYSATVEIRDETRVVLDLFSGAFIRNPQTALDETIEKIYDLVQPTDARDFPAHPLAADNAAQWFEELHNDIATLGLIWREPMVSSEPEGNIVFEWWRNSRKLTIYVAPDEIEYIKVWGPSMIHEMEDGFVTAPRERQELWRWLLDENSAA